MGQRKIALKHVGLIDPDCIGAYLDRGGYEALRKALQVPAEKVIDDVQKAGLRGRGGAGFSTGQKKRLTSGSDCALIDCMHYIVCNADEGEPGTFKDRVIMEGDPHLLIEGTAIAAYAVGATKGYLYIRGEYHRAIERVTAALDSARQYGFVGHNILASGFSLDLEIKLGAGSYLCGEELTLLESLEGKRGTPRIKPPFPAEKGLWGMPTLINNVKTLAHIPAIILNGPDWYRQIGTPSSPGTKIFTISGAVAKPGHYEVEMGTSLRTLVYDLAGGMAKGRMFKTALLGGAAGTFVPKALLDIPMDFDALKEVGAVLGSGAVIVMDEEHSIPHMLWSILRFFEHESCGKCVPCRVGTWHLRQQMERLIQAGQNQAADITALLQPARMMAHTSLCSLGQSPILPIESALRYFEDDFYTPLSGRTAGRPS